MKDATEEKERGRERERERDGERKWGIVIGEGEESEIGSNK